VGIALGVTSLPLGAIFGLSIKGRVLGATIIAVAVVGGVVLLLHDWHRARARSIPWSKTWRVLLNEALLAIMLALTGLAVLRLGN